MIYKYRPDVLDLLIDVEEYPDLDIIQYETDFGVDETEYLYSGKLLLGALVQAEKYYTGLGINTEGLTTVSLAPALSMISGVDLPSIYDFRLCLNEIVNNNGSWILVCERDCDQADVARLNRGSKKSKSALHNLFKFLEEGSISCPTFLIND